MVSLKDDWEKPRTRQNHLKLDEIQRIKVAFNTGTRSRDIARELKCSTRIVDKYYATFRGKPHEKTKYVPKPKVIVRPLPRPEAKPASRFYKGNFDL